MIIISSVYADSVMSFGGKSKFLVRESVDVDEEDDGCGIDRETILPYVVSNWRRRAWCRGSWIEVLP